MRLAALALLFVAGCAKSTESLSKEQLSDLPRLPSPRAGTYARVHQQPADPVVAHVMGERKWESSLAGAAAGLALHATMDTGGFTRRELREVAWQAGYAYPIVSLGAWPTAEAGAPPNDVKTWLASQPADRDIGLVRARGNGKDLWVGLAGAPMIELGIIPREIDFGQQIMLPQKAGAKWWISDGNGGLRAGTLDEPLTLRLGVPGEWVIYVSDASGELARFPVYVDEKAPRLGVLPTVNVSVSNATQVEQRVDQLVHIVRDQYGVDAPELDPMLQNGARLLLKKDGTSDEILAGLGVDPKQAIVWRCTASNVEDCIDQVVWDPRHRLGFVDHAKWLGGYAASWSPDKVEVVGVMIRDL